MASSQEAPPSSCLTNLPVELIQIIGHHVLWPNGLRKLSRWGFGQKDLSRLSRTCRLFRALLQPLLFQQFTLIDRHLPVCTNDTLIRLVAALKERPDMAQRMKSVSICADGGPPGPDERADAGLAALGRNIIDDGLVKLGLSSNSAARRHLMPQFWEGDECTFHVLVQLVLLYAPNVELLHLADGYPGSQTEMYSSKAQVLPNLKYLISEPNPFHYHEYNDWDFAGQPDVLYELDGRTPNLEELWIPSIYSFPTTMSLVHLRRLAITLHGSYISPSTLEEALGRCPGLEAISLSFSEKWTTGAVGEICQELDVRADTLRTIQIDLEHPIIDDIVSFRKFYRLETLEIGSHLLEPWCEDYTISEFLPANIQRLTIWLTPDCPNLLNVLAHFAHSEQGTFPRLQKIVLAPPPLHLKADTDGGAISPLSNFADTIKAWEAVRDRRGGADDMKSGGRVEIEWTAGFWAGEVFAVGL